MSQAVNIAIVLAFSVHKVRKLVAEDKIFYGAVVCCFKTNPAIILTASQQ
jgi:hypothetical protein